MTIAFFGTGLLGANFIRAMRRRGVDVHVWNRTASRARALEETGAKVFDDPAEAARGAERIHLSLSDDAAVDDVLERARLGIAESALLVDHTTTSPSGTAARVGRWDERGVRVIHAPVFMGPQNALDGTGLMLVSGERARVEAVKPAIEPMTGKVIDLGERVDAAAAYKLFGNMFLMFFTSGLAEVFGLARALDVDPREAATLFAHFNPGLTLGARIERMLTGAFDRPSWELAMARKDARLMAEAAREGGAPLAVLPAIAAWMDDMIARGHGKDDWTVLAKDALEGALAASEETRSAPTPRAAPAARAWRLASRDGKHAFVPRLDWDRLRRARPLDGAEARVDPDGAVVWERGGDRPWTPLGARLLRAGVVVRRAKERSARDAGAARRGRDPDEAPLAGAARRGQDPDEAPLAAAAEQEPEAMPLPLPAAANLPPTVATFDRCPQCGASVSARRLVRHVRKTCRARRRHVRDQRS